MNTNLYKSTETSITKNGVEMTLAEAASELQELSRVSYRLECDKINLTEATKQLELERDELRGMLWSGNYNDKQRMAEHDAEVIEKLSSSLALQAESFPLGAECRSKGACWYNWYTYFASYMAECAKEIRQKAKDESK
jgi:hypothetical protein